jgi:YidC/Oxa1 family membrane protein insertase
VGTASIRFRADRGDLVHPALLTASVIGQIFQPLLQAMAWLLAFFYSLIPNYAIAITLLTITVMLVTAPLTVKSTRSMVEMQRVGPELKKIQAKYKGDRVQLNEEMMKLYKEHGINPAGGCVPMLIQMPVFLILYDVIKGLTNTVGKVHPKPYPRYIGHQTRLYENLVHSGGKMESFGINLAQKANTHAFTGVAIVYWLLIAVAVGLQFIQIRQISGRNPAMAQANPQAQAIQKYMPFIFAIIYIKIAAGVNIYFIVSTLCRIGIQEVLFRSGLIKPLDAHSPGGRTKRTLMDRLAEAQQRARVQNPTLGAGETKTKSQSNGKAGDTAGEFGEFGSTGEKQGSGTTSPAAKRPSSPPAKSAASGNRRTTGRPKPGAEATPPSKPQHPRSKAKRARKSR